jgi:hypothetical protein
LQYSKSIFLATQELINKKFGVTRQFLEVHEIELVDGKFKIARIDSESYIDSTLIYFNIKKERFYFVIGVNENEVDRVYVEDYHAVYLKCISYDLNFDQLAAMAKLKSKRGWSKGDLNKNGKVKYSFSSIQFEPNPEPETFEVKLKKLLDSLEQDISGINTLIQNSNAFISVATYFHNGNTMLGGHHLTTDTMRRICNLNLSLDFDNYAEGNLFKN